MLMKIWAVMAPVLACAGVGYFWGRTGRPFDTRTECGDPRPMAFLWERASPAKGKLSLPAGYQRRCLCRR